MPEKPIKIQQQWAKAQKLRAYLQAVESTAAARGLTELQGVPIQEWMHWARRHADRIDPLKT